MFGKKFGGWVSIAICMIGVHVSLGTKLVFQTMIHQSHDKIIIWLPTEELGSGWSGSSTIASE